jgi:aspartate aminotransferase-like enzyme/predicted N-acetyltransferase YhbS
MTTFVPSNPTAISGDVSSSDEPRVDEYAQLGRYAFKPAQTAEEYAQVHRLNYQTFVRELPQHADHGDDRLVDKYHDRNMYWIALYEGRVVGMIAVHDQPPFSIADKMDNPSLLEDLGPRPMEVRLLAIEPEHRHRYVVTGLMWAVFRFAENKGYSHLLISGVSARRRMYERLGFIAVGEAVQSGAVDYIPMWCTLARMREHVDAIEQRLKKRAQKAPPVKVPSKEEQEELESEAMSMMPGPATLSEDVAKSFAQPQMSHRGMRFAETFKLIRHQLAELTGLPTALFVGSGTLANEVVGATLAADRSLNKGLMFINGEFGCRLTHQAKRYGLNFDTLEWEWGKPFDLQAIEKTLEEQPDINWIWAVHMESSTGLMNDIEGLQAVAKPRGVRVCLDCVSSLGAVPIDMTDVHLASGVSNKSLGSIAGLTMVFANPDNLADVDQDRVPSYLDLVESLRMPGPRFTFPSPPVLALATAMKEYACDQSRQQTFDRYEKLGQLVRKKLSQLQLPALIDDEFASPVVTTFSPPVGCTGDAFIQRCLDWGYQIGGESRYLRDRNWLQLATMGDVTEDDVNCVFDRLDTWLKA